MIVCHCAVVSDRSVSEAVASGARTLAQVCHVTDAGRHCGACVLAVRRLVSDVLREDAHLTREARSA